MTDPAPFWDLDWSTLSVFYATQLRGNLFAGFLATAAFLLSAKTYIVILLKDSVYNKPSFHDFHGSKTPREIYSPLRKFGVLLSLGIFLNLLAAGVNFTFGLFNALWCVLLSMSISFFAIIGIAICAYWSYKNLSDVYTFAEYELTQKISKRQARAARKAARELEAASNYSPPNEPSSLKPVSIEDR